jgi:hypothetical protein
MVVVLTSREPKHLKTLRTRALLGFLFGGLCTAPISTASAHPLDHWHICHTNSAGVPYLQGVTFGQNLFVAVGPGGAVYTSPTGEAWKYHPTPGGFTLNAVRYGNGMFVAVANSGYLLSSPNGTNWSIRTCPGISFDYHGINFGNNRFVAVAGNMAAVSTDGVTWTAHNTGVTFAPWFIAFGNGLFLLKHTSGTNRGSSDGTNWFSIPSGSPTGLYTIGFGAGKFISMDIQNNVFTSVNGTNWTSSGSIPLLRPSQIAYGSGHFVTVGADDAVYYSHTGNGWTRGPATNVYVGTSVTYGRGTFVAVGGKQLILQSDPVLWLEPAAPNAFTVAGPQGRTCSIEVSESDPSTDSWQSVTNITLPEFPILWTDPQPPVL